MQKKTCPNGHVYDPSFYGDQCPMCPPSGNASASFSSTQPEAAPMSQFHQQSNPVTSNAGEPGMHTKVASPQLQAGNLKMGMMPGGDAAGKTMIRSAIPGVAAPLTPASAPEASAPKTSIRRREGAAPSSQPSGRRLVGFLVTYNSDPNGRSFNIYEGRNYIGRDASNDICVSGDNQMSSRHMSILYRAIDKKFKFRDEQSSNGTFVNKVLKDEGELRNYDVIRAGGTVFIFIAVPIFLSK